ncbi:MAG: riboflavin synthase [Flavobacteriales bacterium]
MFSGIIEEMGEIDSIEKRAEHNDLIVKTGLSKELYIDQSVSLNGACLTVTDKSENTYKTTVINESLQCTNLGELNSGDKVNLERAIKVGERLDGHIVQGHVDITSECLKISLPTEVPTFDHTQRIHLR